MDQIVRPHELAKRLGIARSTLYQWEKTSPGFPRRLRLGAQVSGWRWSEIEAWLARAQLSGADDDAR